MDRGYEDLIVSEAVSSVRSAAPGVVENYGVYVSGSDISLLGKVVSGIKDSGVANDVGVLERDFHSGDDFYHIDVDWLKKNYASRR
jgi:hypothetical protein